MKKKCLKGKEMGCRHGVFSKFLVTILLFLMLPFLLDRNARAESEEFENLIIAQQHLVTGRITDAETGEALPGVNVIVESTTIGVTSDHDGNYQITIGDGNLRLIFSFIGYQSQVIAVDQRTLINVLLVPDLRILDEFVVIGYGRQRRVNLSGAVGQADLTTLQRRPISNIAQGLQGVIPNLNVDFNEGAPGSEARINIRGFTSINEGEPLILIDGIPVTSRELTLLEPQDVESISVLKDAASAAIYGARAAFGVILVQTKRGVSDGIRINYSSRASWDRPTVLPQKTSDPYIYMRLQDIATSNTPWDYISYSDDMYEWARKRSDNPDSAPAVREDPDNPGTWQYMGDRDWINYFLADYGLSINQTLSLEGRSENASYFLSGSYDRHDGALQIADDLFQRFSLRSRVEYNPYPWLRLGNNTVINTSERIKPSRWDRGEWAMWDFYEHAPMAWDVNPDGTWANTTVGQLAARLTQGGGLNDGRQLFQSTFNSEIPLFGDIFTVNADFTFRRELRNYNWDHKRYRIGHGPDDIREHGSTIVYRNRTTIDYNVFNLFGNVLLPIGNHTITSVFGFNQENYKEYAVISEVANLISSDLPSLTLATGTPTTRDLFSDWAIRGIFFRLNYIFDNRYILEFNGRYDGSSRFPKDNRFGFFPSASAAWRLDQESFMQAFTWLDLFKIRASFGALGNQSVANYGYIPLMSSGRADYIVGDTRPLSISAPGLVSPKYTWEQVFTRNIGLDIDLFEGRISATFDAYTRETIGMLTLGRELPRVLGTSEPRENAADLETKGWEASIMYRDGFTLGGERFNFRTRFILSDSRAWITKFDNEEMFLNQYYVGQEIGEIWGFEFDGFFQTAEEIANLDVTRVIPWGALSVVPGWPKFKDLDNNGRIEHGISVNDQRDMKIIGNSQPRYRFGLTLDFDYRNFDFSIFFQGVGKRDYYPRHYLYWGLYQQPYQGGGVHLFDFYRAEDDNPALIAMHSQSYIAAGLHQANTDAKFPVLQAWLADNREPGLGSDPNTGYMLNAAYTRLKNLTIGYTIPRNLVSRIGIRNLRVFISGENLLEWSELSEFFDPEAVTDDGLGYRYPFQRRYSAGINLGF